MSVVLASDYLDSNSSWVTFHMCTWIHDFHLSCFICKRKIIIKSPLAFLGEKNVRYLAERLHLVTKQHVLHADSVDIIISSLLLCVHEWQKYGENTQTLEIGWKSLQTKGRMFLNLVKKGWQWRQSSRVRPVWQSAVFIDSLLKQVCS